MPVQSALLGATLVLLALPALQAAEVQHSASCVGYSPLLEVPVVLPRVSKGCCWPLLLAGVHQGVLNHALHEDYILLS